MNKTVNSNGYDYVDLCLPSGTLWTTCNVGADKPSDAGLYFQWGDTIGYTKDQVGKDKQFNWANYKWNPSGDGKTFTRYSQAGDTLELVDDAAHMYMGGDWHMPTPEQIQELIDNTISKWTEQDGVSGIALASIKDASKFIFIPAAGGAWDGSVRSSGDLGGVWSSVLSTDGVYGGQYLSFGSGNVSLIDIGRYGGRSVRGVINKKFDNSKDKKFNMNKKLNLVEILKDAPMDTKLYSPICGECELFQVNATSKTYPIVCVGFDDGLDYYFNSDGTYTENEGVECLLFPSKDNRDWSTFKVPNEHKQFEPFQKVLIKDKFCSKYFWVAALYSHFDESTNKHYLVGADWAEDDDIISYDGNEDLLGKVVEIKLPTS